MNNHENNEHKSTIMVNKYVYMFTIGKPMLTTAEKERL